MKNPQRDATSPPARQTHVTHRQRQRPDILPHVENRPRLDLHFE
jgi:hypothetical protein